MMGPPNPLSSSAGSEEEKGRGQDRDEAQDSSKEANKNKKIIVCTLNVEGMWDDQRRQDIYKTLETEQTSGGILLLQDLRMTEVGVKAR